jgi:hypothetical protein
MNKASRAAKREAKKTVEKEGKKSINSEMQGRKGNLGKEGQK